MATDTHDSFDDLPADVTRRGVHRGARPRGRGWVTFAWAALATGVLVGLGVVGLFAVNNGIQFTSSANSNQTSATSDTGTGTGTGSSTPAVTPTVVPTVDPDIQVTILNGTTVEGLATRAGGQATDAGWTVGAEANASESNVTTSTVYYQAAANEGAAKGLAATLGGIAVAVSDQFQGADLTAVLGTDYKDPAAG